MIKLLSKLLNCSCTDIEKISVTSSMTNSTSIYRCRGSKYIVREPGIGSDKLVDRNNEYEAYKLISDKDLSDEVIYYDKDSGIKISKFVENSRTADINDNTDVERIICKLKEFHAMKLTSKNTFDIFDKINYYETLMGTSKYKDYNEIKSTVFELKQYLDKIEKDNCFTHIDPNVDNFLLTKERVYLIDWEYAGMQDPHVDIAMMAIYSMCSKKRLDYLIDVYFDYNCSELTRYKIYAYVAMCGLLWSNWCEYKELSGQVFPEYDLAQYNYARQYSTLALDYFKENL